VKPAAECADLEEIRDSIDRLDRSLIELLAVRSTYVREATKFKTSVSSVRADDRVKAMIEARRTWAGECGIHPDFAQRLFECIVGYFIRGELDQWLNETKQGSGPAIEAAGAADMSLILGIQKRAFVESAEEAGGNYNIAPITETLDQMKQDFQEFTFLKATVDGMIVGSVRAQEKENGCHIGRLVVEPVFQRRGYGTALLRAIESRFPAVREYVLFTGATNAKSIGFYTRHGYSVEDEFKDSDGVLLVWMRKHAALV
jgi:chorismate mutase/predicted N-acetyltransferase YhbS